MIVSTSSWRYALCTAKSGNATYRMRSEIKSLTQTGILTLASNQYLFRFNREPNQSSSRLHSGKQVC